jgi:hypothetical protein
MNSQSLLVPIYKGRQISGTTPGFFYTGSSCYWKIGAPTEWTDNSIIKIKISKLANATCFINTGGTMTTANNETKCEEGQEYSFSYTELNPDSSIFLVTWAEYIKYEPPNNGLVSTLTPTATTPSTTSTTTSGDSSSGGTTTTTDTGVS